MPVKLPLPRHSVEALDNGIRVVLPSRKNVFRIIWFGLWIIAWGCMLGGLIVYVLAPMLLMLVGVPEMVSPKHGGPGVFYVLVAWMALMLLGFLGMGILVIYSLLWQVVGREIIEVDTPVLRVSRQIFGWKREAEYSLENVKDLRASVPQQAFFAPMRSLQYFLGRNGMIAFDYGARTFRFGLEIEEAEAKQIVTALQPHLSR